MMELPRTTYVAPNTTTQIEIPISSNVDFEVSVANWWVTVLEQTTSCLKINIEGYHGEASRKTTITLTNAANNFVQEIKVIQFPHAITTVHLDEEGTHAEKFTLDQMLNIEHLQITGKMDDRDFETLEKFTTLVTIDISGVQLPENMLPELAFDDMLVENIILPSTLTKIGRRAFADNPVLESVDIPSSVTEIGDGAVQNCHGLISAYVYATILSLSESMFYGCDKLRYLELPEKLQTVEDNAFDYVHALLVLKLNSTSTTPLTGEGLDGLQRFRIDLLVDREVQTAYPNDEFWGSCRKINDPTTKTPEDASWDEYVKDRDFWDDFIQEN